jgi:hypothetical protein
MSIEAMRQALEALETLARYENPETRIQIRKPKEGGPIVTMYPHKVAFDAATALRAAIEHYDQTALELCEECGWRALIPGDGCLVCARQKAQPVAWMYDFLSDNRDEVIRDWMTQDHADITRENGFNVRPLYAAPREWVELTDDEARALVNRATFGDRTNWQALVYMVDAKLKEKNAA